MARNPEQDAQFMLAGTVWNPWLHINLAAILLANYPRNLHGCISAMDHKHHRGELPCVVFLPPLSF
jgi:hypothetical protein